MAGHSKWANIKKTKEAQDAKRSAAFSRLSKEIRVAARLAGVEDPDKNPSLKVAVDKAKAANMPKDKIEYAIKKGLGITDDSGNIIENTYEAYGPGGVVFLIDVETDNPNRAISETRTIVTKNGGKMASEGSISWQFKERGQILIKNKSANTEELEEAQLSLLDIAGIIDIKQEQAVITIVTNRETLKDVLDQIKEDLPEFSIQSADLAKLPDNTVDVSSDIYKKLDSFIEALEEKPEVAAIWHNGKS